jgi:hypothetical protein
MESKAGSRNDDNAYNHNFVGQYCRYVSSCWNALMVKIQLEILSCYTLFRCEVQYDPEKEEGTMYQVRAIATWAEWTLQAFMHTIGPWCCPPCALVPYRWDEY